MSLAKCGGWPGGCSPPSAAPIRAGLRGFMPNARGVPVSPRRSTTASAAPPLAEHLGVVIEGINRFPRDLALLTQGTLLALKRGFPVEARAMAERGVKLARQPADRDRFQTLLAGMEGAPPAATAPATAPAAESFLERSISLSRPEAAPEKPATAKSPGK